MTEQIIRGMRRMCYFNALGGDDVIHVASELYDLLDSTHDSYSVRREGPWGGKLFFSGCPVVKSAGGITAEFCLKCLKENPVHLLREWKQRGAA